jgi:hypothetical protein
MNKRPVPKLKTDDEIDNFINTTTKTSIKDKTKRVKKSLNLKKTIDDALRLESAKTRETQLYIMEVAIKEYLYKKGYKNI